MGAAKTRVFLNGGFSDAEYREYKADFNHLNYTIVFKTSLFFIVGLSGVALFLFITSNQDYPWMKFAGWALCFIVLALVAFGPIQRMNHRGSLALAYAFLSLTYLLGMDIGVWASPYDSAIILFAFVIVFSVLISDKIWRYALFLVLWGVVFCMITTMVKEPAIASNDIAHMVAIIPLSLFLAYYTSKMRINAIKYRVIAEKQRDTDSVTGLASRRRFDQEVDQVTFGTRAEDLAGIIAMDIDFFKAYNDTYGHQAGDICLRRVAHAMRAAANTPGAFIARNGGEEFTAIIRRTCACELPLLAEQIRKAVERENIESKQAPLGHITISVGFAQAESIPDGDIQELISHADRALYAAKIAGRNQVCGWKKTNASRQRAMNPVA